MTLENCLVGVKYFDKELGLDGNRTLRTIP